MRTRDMLDTDHRVGKRNYGAPAVSRFKEINDRMAEIVRQSREIHRPRSTDYSNKK